MVHSIFDRVLLQRLPLSQAFLAHAGQKQPKFGHEIMEIISWQGSYVKNL